VATACQTTTTARRTSTAPGRERVRLGPRSRAW
jgi:hypothetical protein